jgi:hypothetical protein
MEMEAEKRSRRPAQSQVVYKQADRDSRRGAMKRIEDFIKETLAEETNLSKRKEKLLIITRLLYQVEREIFDWRKRVNKEIDEIENQSIDL